MRQNNEKVRKLEETILVIVIICVAMSLLIFGHPLIANDTDSYIEAWNAFASGQLSAKRTPVYSLVIGLASAISGKAHMGFVIILIQNFAASIAVWIFYKIARRATNSQNVSFFSALFFACFSIYLLFRNWILTESLALSGLLFLIYCTINIYDGKSKWNILGLTFWLLFLTFLRPSFLYLPPVLAVAFIIMIFKKKRQRKQALCSLASVAFVTVCLLLYMATFKSIYGVFTTTNIGMVNDADMMLQTKDLNPNYSKDEKLKKYIKEMYEGKDVYYEMFNYIFAMPDYSDLEQTIHKSKTLQNQLSNIGYRLRTCPGESLREHPGRSEILNFINFAFFCGFLTIIIYGLALMVYIVKNRSLPWLPLLLLMLGASNIIVVIIGAQAEWQRLVYPSKAIYLIMIVQLLLGAWRLFSRPPKTEDPPA